MFVLLATRKMARASATRVPTRKLAHSLTDGARAVRQPAVRPRNGPCGNLPHDARRGGSERRRRRKRRGETAGAELNLTALVDVLTVLVIFGLINFNPAGELL